jgi:hypothetical protein
MAMVNEIEDRLDDFEVFQNGINGGQASLGAYMTVIDFNNLNTAWDVLIKEFSIKDLNKCIGHWKYQSYLSPTFNILAGYFKNKLKDL